MMQGGQVAITRGHQSSTPHALSNKLAWEVEYKHEGNREKTCMREEAVKQKRTKEI